MSTKTVQKLTIEDFILYILNKLEPEKSDKIRLNKLAFFTEFAFLHRFNQPLSNAEYAGISLGPVIDNYDTIMRLSSLNKKKRKFHASLFHFG